MRAEEALALKQSALAELIPKPDWRALFRNPWAWAASVSCALLIGRCVADTFAAVHLDEGVFLTIAQEILHGRLPYRDVFDHKGPAIYYLLAGVLALTGHLPIIAQVFTARMVGVFANGLTALGIVILGRRWWRLEVGVLAALLWLFALPVYLGDSVLTEPFSTAPVVWALALAARRADVRSACGVGLLIALGSLFKQTAVLAAPGVALLCLVHTTQASRRWRITTQQVALLIALAVGLIVPWLVVGTAFTAAGALQPMLNQVIRANVSYPPDSFETITQELLAAIQADPVIPLLPPLVIVVGLARWFPKPHRTAHIPSLGAIVTTALYICNLLPFFSHAYAHYWLPVAPWAALLAALGIVAVFDRAQARIASTFGLLSRRTLSHLVLMHGSVQKGLVILLLALAVLAGSGQIVAMFQKQSAALHTQLAAGAWIARYTPPGARLLIAPAEPEYYYLSQYLPITSYLYVFPVNSSPALLAQVSEQLRTQQFTVVVWEDVPASIYQGIRQQLLAHYRAVASNASEHLTLYLPLADSSHLKPDVGGR